MAAPISSTVKGQQATKLWNEWAWFICYCGVANLSCSVLASLNQVTGY